MQSGEAIAPRFHIPISVFRTAVKNMEAKFFKMSESELQEQLAQLYLAIGYMANGETVTEDNGNGNASDNKS